jgi:hypothetical protein
VRSGEVEGDVEAGGGGLRVPQEAGVDAGIAEDEDVVPALAGAGIRDN